MRKGIEKMRFLKKLLENGCFWGLMDEIYMVLLARACGNGDFRPNVADKSVFRVQETLKIIGISVKNWKSSRNGSRKIIFEVWVVESMQFFSANFTVIVVSGQTLLKNSYEGFHFRPYNFWMFNIFWTFKTEMFVFGSRKQKKSKEFQSKTKIFTKWVEKKYFWGLSSGIDAVF